MEVTGVTGQPGQDGGDWVGAIERMEALSKLPLSKSAAELLQNPLKVLE